MTAPDRTDPAARLRAAEPKVYTAPHERSVLRTAKREHRCWSWADNCSPPGESFSTEYGGVYDGGRPCTRLIGPGEEYLENTIYPGHDSGYADDCVKWVGGVGWERCKPRPIRSRFCLPCAGRWINLKPALAALTTDAILGAPEAGQ